MRYKFPKDFLWGVATASALFVFIGNMCANIAYGIVDPRIRQGSEDIDG